jgi:hypothetical protein
LNPSSSAQPNGRTPREQYREVYLRSEHWREIRLAALERAEHRCQVCNRTERLDVHHRTYERVGDERPADLTVLCRRCHDLFHGNARVNDTRSGKPRLTKAERRARKKARAEANPRKVLADQARKEAAPAKAIYVSPSEKERYDQMREAELERRREAKRERAQRRSDVAQRRVANAKTRDWRDEQELPRKT